VHRVHTFVPPRRDARSLEAPTNGMDMEFRDDRRRGKFIIVLGLILAVGAGGAAFYLVNQAQSQAGQQDLQKVSIVVAVRAIPARQAIVADDVAIREVPLDPTNANGVVTDPNQVIGRIPAVSILQDQPVTQNMLVSADAGDEFSILQPEETVGPDSIAWRAVSVTVPDDLAVGGVLKAGETVDVFVTAVVQVPPDIAAAGRYTTDRSTKLVYQNVLILDRKAQFYILKASLPMAEELSHLEAVGTATMSMVLRPDTDQREVDAASLGETTNRIIQKYNLPIPENYPRGNAPLPVQPPVSSPTAFPTQAPAASTPPASTAP
jgi:Flp pilus assembly protein CpaB